MTTEGQDLVSPEERSKVRSREKENASQFWRREGTQYRQGRRETQPSQGGVGGDTGSPRGGRSAVLIVGGRGAV